MDGVITAVENDSDPTIPSSFRLEQNYPNPFNPSTTIEFSLPSRSHVLLSVWNVIGEEIAVLMDEEWSAGVHQIVWDTSGLPSGVYLYRLQVENFINTRKMVLMK